MLTDQARLHTRHLHTRWLEGIEQEWRLRTPQTTNNNLLTLYLGGGTPSLLSEQELEKLLSLFPLTSCQEITLEANPEGLTKEKLASFKKLGINRLSIGIQSLDQQQLKKLQRQHTAQEARMAVLWAYEAGFTNISIDLMYDLPDQTLASWEATLQAAIELPITHLSLYNLTLEPGSSFFHRRKQVSAQMPDPTTSLQMYTLACNYLQFAQLERYEISAFAKRGYRSKHNSGYWTGRPFLGLGPSAHSFWDTERFSNISHFDRYLEALNQQALPIGARDPLPLNARRRELFAIHIRLSEGVNRQTFEKTWGPLENETLHTLRELTEKGWIKSEENRFYLTKEGTLFYDELASWII